MGMCSCRFPLDPSSNSFNVDGILEVKQREINLEQENGGHLLRQRVHIELQRLKTYRSILQVKSVDHRRWPTWQTLAEECEQNPAQVVRYLSSLQQHDLAHRVMQEWSVNKIPITSKFHQNENESNEDDQSKVGKSEIKLVAHSKNELRSELQENQVLHLLTECTFNDKARAFSILASINVDDACMICESLLEKVKEIDTKLLLAQFLQYLLSTKDIKEKENRDEKASENDILAVKELSLNILVRLPAELQTTLRHLIGFPNLLVEALLMEQKTDLVMALFRDFQELRCDEVVIRYAGKALN